MRKYSSLSGPHAPAVFFALPELSYPEQLNAVRTLLDAIDANSWGERTALIFRGSHVSYAELRRHIHRYAGGLRRLGVREGDRVLIRIDDRPELIFSVLAVQAIGAVAVPTYPQLRTADLVYRADDSEAKVALVGDNLLAEADPRFRRTARTHDERPARADATGPEMLDRATAARSRPVVFSRAVARPRR